MLQLRHEPHDPEIELGDRAGEVALGTVRLLGLDVATVCVDGVGQGVVESEHHHEHVVLIGRRVQARRVSVEREEGVFAVGQLIDVALLYVPGAAEGVQLTHRHLSHGGKRRIDAAHRRVNLLPSHAVCAHLAQLFDCVGVR